MCIMFLFFLEHCISVCSDVVQFQKVFLETVWFAKVVCVREGFTIITFGVCFVI